MKKILIIVILFTICIFFKAQYKTTTWSDTLTERSIEYLLKDLVKTKNNSMLEVMKERILISHSGRVINNKHFDEDTSEIIIKQPYEGSFLFKDNVLKALKYLKTDKIVYWKVNTYTINDYQYILLNENLVGKTNLKYERLPYTIVIFKYKFNKDKGDYDLESVELNSK